MSTPFDDKYVLSVGGSLIVTKNGIDTDFLSRLNSFVRTQLRSNKNRQFFLVTGGGSLARDYRDAGRSVVGHEITEEDQDWLGIHATRLNAHLMRTIFQDIAHPNIIKDYDIIRKVKEQVIIAAGWKPGWSTDYDAVLLCEDYHAKKILNLSNIPQVYDKDPNKFPDAKAIERMRWDELRRLVGENWHPGMHAPFDPVAARRAQDLGITVAILHGNNFDNIDRYINGESFVGTVIS